MKIDMHVHTCYSPDSVITPEDVILFGRKRGLQGIAVTDHDTIEGAKKIAAETDFLVIPSIEIHSIEGHVVGLNVSKPVPSGLVVNDTVEKIHEAGGIAVACHPVGFFKGGLGKRTNSRFDAVEVINASSIPFDYAKNKSMKIAFDLRKPRLAGSDAHYAPEIGCAYTVVNAEPNVDDIIESILHGLCEPFGNPIPLRVRMKRMIEINKKRIRD